MLTISVCLVSCKTTEKFTVSTPSGMQLYLPNNQEKPIATADGKPTKVEVPSAMYCGYMIAKPEDSNFYIPFGIDFHEDAHKQARAAVYSPCVGFPLMFSSIACLPLIVPTGLIFISTVVAVPVATDRFKQTAYDYNFGYDKKQVFEMPHLSANLLHPNPPKGATTLPAPSASGRKKASSGKEISTQTESGSKAKKNRSDFARTISGTYNGTGKLLVGKTIDENYPEISVVIERIDKNHVKVRVIESGEDFFDGVLTYTATRNKKGGYLLSIDNLPEATITVSKTGKLEFNHKKVNIDNTMYTLHISATKSTSE